MENKQEKVDVPPALPLPPRLKSSDKLYVQGMLTLVPSPISIDASLMTMMPLPRSSTLSNYQNDYLPPVVGGIKSSQLSDICSEFDPLRVQNTVESTCNGDFVELSTGVRTMKTLHSLEIADVESRAARGGFLSGSSYDSQEIVYEHLKWTSPSTLDNKVPVVSPSSRDKLLPNTSLAILDPMSVASDCSVHDWYNTNVPAAQTSLNRDSGYIPPPSFVTANNTYMDMRGMRHNSHSRSVLSDASGDLVARRSTSVSSETASCRSNESSVFEKSSNFVTGPNVHREAYCSASSVSDEDVYEEYKPSFMYQNEPIYQMYHLKSVVFSSLFKNVIGNGTDSQTVEGVEVSKLDFKGDDFIKLSDDPEVSGKGADESETIDKILSRSTKLRSLEGSSELLRTLQNLTSTCAPIKRRLWSNFTRVQNSGVLSQIDINCRVLQECLFEIITSQTSYVKSLDIALNHFRKPLKQSQVLSKLELSHLFSNMKAVTKASHQMQKALENVWISNFMLDPVEISDIVKACSSESASLYVIYCRNAVYQDRTLKELQKRPAFTSELAKLEVAKEAHKQTLQSFLILPNQRVMRIPMLMEAVLSRLGSTYRDETTTHHIKDCLTVVQKIASECDEGAREMHNLEKLHSINSKLIFKKVKTFPLIHSERTVLKMGEMTSIKCDSDHRNLRKRLSQRIRETRTLWCCLFNDVMIIAKPKRDRYDVKHCVPRNSVRVAELGNPEEISSYLPSGLPADCQNLMSISINSDGGFKLSYMIGFKKRSDRLRWIEAFNHAVDSDTTYEISDCMQMQLFKAYVAQEPDELDLNDSDVVCVLRQDVDGWCEGERIRDGRRGWFHASYAVEIESPSARRSNIRRKDNLIRQSGRHDTNGVLLPRSLGVAQQQLQHP